MKNKKVLRIILGMSLTATLVAGSSMCFPSSAHAYSRCTDSWSAQLEPVEENVKFSKIGLKKTFSSLLIVCC